MKRLLPTSLGLAVAALALAAPFASAQAEPAGKPQLRQCDYANIEYDPTHAKDIDRRRFGAMVQCLINNERIARGLPQVTWNAELAGSAQLHVQDMISRNYFSHYAKVPTPNGSEPYHRAAAAGYPFWEIGGVGEILHWGSPTPRRTVESWLKSQGHCREIVGPFEHVGLGLYRDPKAAGKPAMNVSTATVWATTFGRTTSKWLPVSPEVAKARSGCPYRAGLTKGPAPTAGVSWPRNALKVELVDGKVEVSGRVNPGPYMGPKPKVTVTLINPAKKERSTTVELFGTKQRPRVRTFYEATLTPPASEKSWTVRVRMVGVSDPVSETTRSFKR